MEPKPPEIQLTVADAEAALGNPAAKTYLAYIGSFIKGDRARIRALSPPESLAQIDSPAFPEMLKAMLESQERGVRVLKAITSGNLTKLWVTGKSPDGKPRQGEALMKLENGGWLLRNENWRNQ